jgi:hypothetical protein
VASRESMLLPCMRPQTKLDIEASELSKRKISGLIKIRYQSSDQSSDRFNFSRKWRHKSITTQSRMIDIIESLEALATRPTPHSGKNDEGRQAGTANQFIVPRARARAPEHWLGSGQFVAGTGRWTSLPVGLQSLPGLCQTSPLFG